MAPASGRFSDLSNILSVDPKDPRFRWLMLWSVSPTGECCCPEGSVHRRINDRSGGSTRDCGNGAGKHPWSLDGRGYVHGVEDADESPAAAIKRWGPLGGARRWGVTLGDVLVIDIDSERALQSVQRFGKHLPHEKVMGVAKTPRGLHIYVDAPGWTQRSLNWAMRQWLDDWHGTDVSKVSRRGFLVDVRTGPNRYVVWPGQSRDRRWMALGELLRAWPVKNHMPAHRLVESGELAPWNRPMDDELRAKIRGLERDAPVADPVVADHLGLGGVTSRTVAENDLRRWSTYLASMPADSGRNNKLNQIAYYQGARAITAGVPEPVVRQRLTIAAQRCGMMDREIEPTITSGLSSGLQKLTRVS